MAKFIKDCILGLCLLLVVGATSFIWHIGAELAAAMAAKYLWLEQADEPLPVPQIIPKQLQEIPSNKKSKA